MIWKKRRCLEKSANNLGCVVDLVRFLEEILVNVMREGYCGWRGVLVEWNDFGECDK